MNKLSIAFVSAAVVLLMAPLAFADINLQSFGFKINGNTNDTIQPGDDFGITVNSDVNGGDEVEYFRIRLLDTDDNIVSTDCQAVGRVRDINDENIRFDTETPNDIPNGQYTPVLLPFGIPGEAQSNGCDLDNDYPGDEEEYPGRLFIDDDEEIVGNDDDNNTGSNDDDTVDAIMKAICAKFPSFCATTPVPSTSPKCETLKTKLLGTMDNVYNQANVMLQGYLLGEGQSIPALAAGASFGYKGPQTNAALANYKAMNQCAF